MICKPDLRVIDSAIQRIKDRDNQFTCHALDAAARHYHVGYEYKARFEYRKQYARYVLSINEGKLPFWWSKGRTLENTKARLEALEGFKQACIEAGTKK